MLALSLQPPTMVDEEQKRSPSSNSKLIHWSENIWEELNSIAASQTSIERLLSSRTMKQGDETRKHNSYQTGDEVSTKQVILDLIYKDFVFGESTSSSRHDESSATSNIETAECITFNVDTPSQKTQTVNQSRNPETVVTDRKKVNKACQSNIRSISSKEDKIGRVKKPEHNVTIPIDCSKTRNQSTEQGKTEVRVVHKIAEEDIQFDKENNNNKDDLVEEEIGLYNVISVSSEKNMNVLRNKSITHEHATIESTNEKKKLIQGKIQDRDLKKSMKSIQSERNQSVQGSFFPSSSDAVNQKCSSKLIQILKRENKESKMALKQSAIVLNNLHNIT